MEELVELWRGNAFKFEDPKRTVRDSIREVEWGVLQTWMNRVTTEGFDEIIINREEKER